MTTQPRPTESDILRQARDLGVAPAVIELPYLKAEHAEMHALLETIGLAGKQWALPPGVPSLIRDLLARIGAK